MVRPTGQQITAIEKIVTVPKRRGPRHGGRDHMGKHLGGSGGRGGGGRAAQEPLLWFCRKAG